MRPVELDQLKGGRRKSEYERTRDKHIRENMWKATHAARKVSGFSGVPFDELRSVALEAMVKLYDKWDPELANFSTWLNRSLTFQLLNYLRDSSRMVRMPRIYADAYMKIRKIISRDPDVSNAKLSEITGLSATVIQETRNAFQVTYQEINEDTEIPAGEESLDEDSLAGMFRDYGTVLDRISSLTKEDYDFLADVYIHRRAQSTLFRKYQGVTKSEHIQRKTDELMATILEGQWQRDT
jgi:DNA-directed RNA polymerase specialized sigma24 family protein